MFVGFPDMYWQSPRVEQDVDFLSELETFSGTAAGVVATALFAAYERSSADDERKILAVRLFNESMQAFDLFLVHLLAIRERSKNPFLVMFVQHHTSDVVDMLGRVARLVDVESAAALLRLRDMDQRDPEPWLCQVALAFGRSASTVVGGDSAMREFHNKARHGAVIVRDFRPSGDPYFGPSDTQKVVALSVQKPLKKGERAGPRLITMGTSREKVENYVAMAGRMSEFTATTARHLRRAIRERAL